jgi:hypothetical protein
VTSRASWLTGRGGLLDLVRSEDDEVRRDAPCVVDLGEGGDRGIAVDLETRLGGRESHTGTVQWTGVGELENRKDVSKFVFATGDWLRVSLKGNLRGASVTGSFILNGEDLIAGTTSTVSMGDVTVGSHTKGQTN